ncbi:unnamed protein product [Trichobilharzia szidati]|nr:unnamed protein product [Trichobilharzia szidati]
MIMSRNQSSPPSPPQIYAIGVGLPRTGTTSLHAALEILYHGRCYRLFEDMRTRRDDVAKWQRLMDEAKSSKNAIINKNTVYEILSGFNSMVDLPGSVLHKEMLQIFPNAKFILSWRDKHEWLSSIRETISLPRKELFAEGIVGQFIIGLLVGTGMQQLIDNTLYYAYGKEFDHHEDDETCLKLAELYIEKVKRNIPPDQLLIHHYKDGWEPLCKFLNLPIPQQPYPFKNERQEIKGLLKYLRIMVFTANYAIPVICILGVAWLVKKIFF